MKNKIKLTNWDSVKVKLLKDHKVRKEYKLLEPEYNAISKIIKLRLQKKITQKEKSVKKTEEKSNEKISKHPKYYPNTKVTCACGNTFEVGSTMPEIRIEICSACHPLYSGKNKFIDAAGRVDKFQERVRKAKEIQAKNSKKIAPKTNKNKAKK